MLIALLRSQKSMSHTTSSFFHLQVVITVLRQSPLSDLRMYGVIRLTILNKALQNLLLPKQLVIEKEVGNILQKCRNDNHLSLAIEIQKSPSSHRRGGCIMATSFSSSSRSSILLPLQTQATTDMPSPKYNSEV